MGVYSVLRQFVLGMQDNGFVCGRWCQVPVEPLGPSFTAVIKSGMAYWFRVIMSLVVPCMQHFHG